MLEHPPASFGRAEKGWGSAVQNILRRGWSVLKRLGLVLLKGSGARVSHAERAVA